LDQNALALIRMIRTVHNFITTVVESDTSAVITPKLIPALKSENIKLKILDLLSTFLKEYLAQLKHYWHNVVLDIFALSIHEPCVFTNWKGLCAIVKSNNT
jgi:hypothetical protein